MRTMPRENSVNGKALVCHAWNAHNRAAVDEYRISSPTRVLTKFAWFIKVGCLVIHE